MAASSKDKGIGLVILGLLVACAQNLLGATVVSLKASGHHINVPSVTFDCLFFIIYPSNNSPSIIRKIVIALVLL
jgi:hypothetical protein